MKTLKAWQIIYGNVEEEDSPRQTRGFQTLRLSEESGIGAAELASLEARLVYSPDPTYATTKSVFYHDDTKRKVMLARAKGVPGRDRVGRAGRYVAHGLVFGSEDLAELAQRPCDLLTIFDKDRDIDKHMFILEMGDVFDPRDRMRYDIGPAEVKTGTISNQEQIELVRDWQGEYKKLALLALAADSLRADKRMVLFLGTPDDVLSAVKAAFIALPTWEFAAQCTFDTYFEGCNPVSTYYWGVGMAKAPGGVRFVQVDAQARRVIGELPFKAETCYQCWVGHCVDSDKRSVLVKDREKAYDLCQYFEGKGPRPTLLEHPQRHRELIESVVDANPHVLEDRLLARISEQLPEKVASRVFNEMVDDFRQGGVMKRLRDLGEPMRQEDLHDKLYQAWEKCDFEKPPGAELAELNRYPDLPPDMRLIVACWMGKGIQPKLKALPNDKYANFLKMALVKRIGDPVGLLTSDHAEDYLELFLSDRKYQRASISRLVDRLLEVGRGDLIPELAAEFEEMPPKELAPVRQIILRRVNRVAHDERVADVVLFMLIREEYPEPTRWELRAYRKLAAASEHQQLGALVACWRGRDWEIRRQLMRLASESYREFVFDALRYEIGKASHLLVVDRERAPIFVEILVENPQWQRGSLPDLVDRLLRVQAEECLSKLTPLLDDLDWPNLRMVRRSVDRAKGIAPEDFVETLNDCLLAKEPWPLRLVKWLLAQIAAILSGAVEAIWALWKPVLIVVLLFFLIRKLWPYLPYVIRFVFDFFSSA